MRGFAAALTLVVAGSVTGLLAGSATAAAAPPIVIGDCSTSVQGAPGTPVSLSPSAVLGVVVDAVRAVPLLGPPLAGAARDAFAALPPIPIGALPTGTGYITGGTIANAVTAQLRQIPLLGPVLSAVVASVQSTLTSMCGVTVTGVNAAAAPVQDGAKSVADASEQATGQLPGTSPGPGGGAPGTGGPSTGAPGGGTPGDGGVAPTMPGPNQPVLGGVPGSGMDLGRFLWTGRSPMSLYGSIPFARPGLFVPSPGVRYGGSVSGYTPQFGILGSDDADGVQAAGHAEALRPPGGNKIALPVLLAVFALSGVTAALVRTWVLRKAPAV
ncbi:hypothetical protein [Actinophytocola sp.]|uniref:hypothetical protein n=1 Tax=Actinophytocola sp. TaxID=1872138 RepID=UPI002DDC93FD|nr:hypothetical protein [Actinophytocola sp.]